MPVNVRVEPHVHGGPVPAGFLGLSFEASALPQIAAYGSSGNFVNLLRSLGSGVLRFGGISADSRIAWTDGATPRPAWTSLVLEAADLQRLGALARGSGWPVLLTVGLAHFDPRAAAREVRVAKQALGPWLAGVEVGNEPDAYARHGLRARPWNPCALRLRGARLPPRDSAPRAGRAAPRSRGVGLAQLREVGTRDGAIGARRCSPATTTRSAATRNPRPRSNAC